MGGLLGEDKNVPFDKLNRRLVPGDVPFDNPPLHHKEGWFNLGGLLRDEEHDVLINQTVRMACCRCLPGAPGWPESTPPPPPLVEEPAAEEVPAEGGESEPAPAAGPEDEGAIPIVDAVPIEQAVPVDGGANDTVAADAGAAAPAAADPVPAAPEAPPAEGRRRLLNWLPKGRPGSPWGARHATGRSPATRPAVVRKTRLAAAEEAVGRLNEEYLMVKVPDGARAGEMFQAISPVTGRSYAFVVPSNVPADRLIRLQLPVASATPLVSVKLHHSSLDDEAPPAEGALPDTTLLPDTTPPPAANGTPAPAPEDTVPAGEPAEAPAAEPEPAAEEEPAAADDAAADDADAGAPEGYSREGVPIGFGVGLSPPRAQRGERCCYCPLYDTESGTIMAWVPHPPKYPRRAAAAYARMAAAIEERHRHIEAVLGRPIDVFHQAEKALRLAPPAPSPPPAVEAVNATSELSNGTAETANGTAPLLLEPIANATEDNQTANTTEGTPPPPAEPEAPPPAEEAAARRLSAPLASAPRRPARAAPAAPRGQLRQQQQPPARAAAVVRPAAPVSDFKYPAAAAAARWASVRPPATFLPHPAARPAAPVYQALRPTQPAPAMGRAQYYPPKAAAYQAPVAAAARAPWVGAARSSYAAEMQPPEAAYQVNRPAAVAAEQVYQPPTAYRPVPQYRASAAAAAESEVVAEAAEEAAYRPAEAFAHRAPMQEEYRAPMQEEYRAPAEPFRAPAAAAAYGYAAPPQAAEAWGAARRG